MFFTSHQQFFFVPRNSGTFPGQENFLYFPLAVRGTFVAITWSSANLKISVIAILYSNFASRFGL